MRLNSSVRSTYHDKGVIVISKAHSNGGHVFEVISDPKFQSGFDVWSIDGCSPEKVGKLDYGGTVASQEAQYRIAQWWSKEDISPAGHGIETREGDLYIYRDHVKSIHVNPKTGYLYLEMNGKEEYTNRRVKGVLQSGLCHRKDGEEWPSILVEQFVKNTARITELKKAIFEIEFTITKSESFMEGLDDEKVHSAQFQWITTVQNANGQKKDAFGDFFWFGLPFYDCRYVYPKKYEERDIGKEDATNKYIVLLEGQKFLSRLVMVGERIRVCYDILPDMIEAFHRAQQMGYMRNTELSDLRPGAFNLGWEVTGTYHVAVEIYNISLKYYK